MGKFGEINYSREIKRSKSSVPATNLYSKCKDDGTDEAYQQAIQTICDIKGFMRNLRSREPFGIKLAISGSTRADYDNILKGVVDSLEGVFYENDRQVKLAHYWHTDFHPNGEIE